MMKWVRRIPTSGAGNSAISCLLRSVDLTIEASHAPPAGGAGGAGPGSSTPAEPVWTIRDGRIARYEEHQDRAGALEAAGLSGSRRQALSEDRYCSGH